MGEIRAAYAYSLYVGEPLQEELTRVRSFMLFLIDRAVALSGGRGDAAASAWKTTLWNVVESMSERDVYTADQVAALSDAIITHYPRLSVILTESDRLRLHDRIKGLAVAERDEEAREAYRRLLEVVSR
jgi:hypothetical protein